jgi:hypothetical protein
MTQGSGERPGRATVVVFPLPFLPLIGREQQGFTLKGEKKRGLDLSSVITVVLRTVCTSACVCICVSVSREGGDHRGIERKPPSEVSLFFLCLFVYFYCGLLHATLAFTAESTRYILLC